MLKRLQTISIALMTLIALPGWGQKNIVEKSRYYDVYERLLDEEYDNWWNPAKPSKNPLIVKISTQAEFDAAEAIINKALRSGHKDIKVEFARGPFYFKGEHVILRGEDVCSDANLRLVGNNTVLIPVGKHYKKGDIYNGDFSVKNIYLDSRLQDLNIWGQMYHSDQMVEVLDVNKKLCRIHCPEFTLSNTSVSDETYLQLTEWYLSSIYKVTKIEGNYIYFIAEDLKPGLSAYGNYNVNYDYTIVKVFPRFRVCNLDDETSAVNFHKGKPVNRDFYECKGYTFLRLYGAVYNSVEITGFKFYGNVGLGMLLDFRAAKVARGIHVHDCEFRNIKSVGIYMMQTSNVVINGNIFEDCYSDAVLAIDKVKNTIVIDNYFHSIGKGLRSCFAVHCQSSNFYVARNTIVDFGLGGIGVGKGSSEGFEAGSGIVEDNVLYYTDAHHKWSAANGLIDGGAIYLWTRNDATIIRYNRIHNYTGAHSNRGIYCDDGAYGFTLYGNIITGDLNSNFIDSRLVPSADLPTNTNNVIEYNIVEGRYKFEGSNKSGNGCVKGKNIVLNKANSAPHKIVLGKFDKAEEDVNLEYKWNKDLSIVVPRSTRSELKKLPFYSRIKKYIKIR